MTLIRKFALVGGAAVAALMLMSAIAVTTASAQAALPYKAYGAGLKAGQVVEAWNNTVSVRTGRATSVGKATANASGQWSIDIQPTAAANGDVISFKIDGAAAAQTVTFQSGQFPAPPGIALTAAPAAPAAPAPARTGNAGLAGSTGASMALVLALGVIAATFVAGARTATRSR